MISDVEINLTALIKVTIVDWVNVPNSKRAGWDRLHAAVMAHEMLHVRDASGVITDAKKRAAVLTLKPTFRLVCGDAAALKAAREELRAEVRDFADYHALKAGDWISTRYQKLRDDLDRREGRIPIIDYITP